MTRSGFSYVGDELSVFAEARNWKRYFHSHLAPYLRGRVLEVGAGLGASTLALYRDSVDAWIALEPDESLARQARTQYAAAGLAKAEVRLGTIASLCDDSSFDTILYIDVLEHIGDDVEELGSAARRLRPGGHLIVLAPAHQWLYSRFDEAIGHHRRYNALTLRGAVPRDMTEVSIRYLDAVGLVTSLANRLLLRSSSPSRQQIRTWDRFMVPVSTMLDPLFGFLVGKSVMGIWRRP